MTSRRLTFECLELRLQLSVVEPIGIAIGGDSILTAEGHWLVVDPVPDIELIEAAQQVAEASIIAEVSYALGDTFLLHSNPGASKVAYLDFDGHAGDPAYSIDGDSGFNDTELQRIQQVWERVAKDLHTV